MQFRLVPWVYDLVMARAEHGRLGRWRDQLVGAVTGRTLEIGAGTGLTFAHYPVGTWVVATDPDVAMLDRAKARAALARATILLVVADGEALPFRDGAFSEAIVGLAMCTIPHPERALDELGRALEPNGRLRLLEHVRLDNPLFGRLQDWMTPIWRRVAGGCRLNRRTALVVDRSRLFSVTSVRSYLGGYVQNIVAVRIRTQP
jgi:ubiquinone/menaquinone biosynthesis C-methylase UbiE